jgi:hypothetical protein
MPIGRKKIGAPRFELGTSPTRTVRATRLRHAPIGSVNHAQAPGGGLTAMLVGGLGTDC